MITPEKISAFNRKRKYDLFLKEINPLVSDTILDVGFNNIEHSSVDNFLEKSYPYPHNITALGVGCDSEFKIKYPKVKSVIYDGKRFPFQDKSFDIGWSNAVLEHVGNTERQILFLKELNRTCRRIYFTTPNRYFPFELHTRIPLLHWLPKNIFDKLISFTPKKWATGEYMYLLSKKKLKYLLKQAEITDYQIYQNHFCGFVMDFSVLIK